MAVNVTANWQLIRHMNVLLRRSDAGRVVFMSSGSAANARAYRGLYAASKAALEVLARTYAAETAIDADQGQPVLAGPDTHAHARHRDAGRGPDDTADAGRGRRDDRAALPAELPGNRKDLRLPRRQAQFVPRAGLAP